MTGRRVLRRGCAPQRVVDALRLRVPLTTSQLERSLCLGRRTAEEAVRTLHARGEIRIAGFALRTPRQRGRRALHWTIVHRPALAARDEAAC
jgi:hypothetical protein